MCSHGLMDSNLSVSLGLPGPCKDILASEITKHSCKVSWDPPDYDGGTPVIHYVMQVCVFFFLSRLTLCCDSRNIRSFYLICRKYDAHVCLCSGGRLAGGPTST